MELGNRAISRLVAEFEGVELGDERRSARAALIMEALARAPGASLPEAMRTEAATEAAYRFLGNDAFKFEDLLLEHHEQTAGRARQTASVLVLHDTTTCKYGHLPPKELGYLSTRKAGFYLHAGLVLDADHHRRPLGIIHAEALWRSQPSARGGRKKRVSGAGTAKWKDREYLRWSRGIHAAEDRLDGAKAVHVIDREGDCYALFADCVEHDYRFIIRSRNNRVLANGEKLREVLTHCQGLLEREVPLSPRRASTAPDAKRSAPARKSRIARLQYSARSVTLRRTQGAGLNVCKQLNLNVVHVQEVDPPAGEPEVCWYLWTTEPVDTAEQVEAVVDNYRRRWVIEEFFKALKTGCKYEARLLESRHSLLNLLAFSMPIAVELLWIRARASDEPNAPATEVLTELQLNILRQVGHRPLGKRPTAAEALWALAGLGGHLKSNGIPGWQVLKRAYEKLLAYEVGWVAALTTKGAKM